MRVFLDSLRIFNDVLEPSSRIAIARRGEAYAKVKWRSVKISERSGDATAEDRMNVAKISSTGDRVYRHILFPSAWCNDTDLLIQYSPTYI